MIRDCGTLYLYYSSLCRYTTLDGGRGTEGAVYSALDAYSNPKLIRAIRLPILSGQPEGCKLPIAKKKNADKPKYQRGWRARKPHREASYWPGINLKPALCSGGIRALETGMEAAGGAGPEKSPPGK